MGNEPTKFFEQPCLAGWVYPCSLDDIIGRLAELPAKDTEGLWAVGLANSTRKHHTANGRYTFSTRPLLRIYSYRETLRYKLPAHTKLAEIERGLCLELAYGMTIERQGSRFITVWDAPALRHFILDHVLAHEVGHHVHFRHRHRLGYTLLPSRVEAEHFAEAYALRHSRRSFSQGETKAASFNF